MNEYKNLSMFSKIIITTITILLITIISLTIAFYYISLQAINNSVKNELTSTASIISDMKIVQDALLEGKEDKELNKLIDNIISAYNHIDVITIANMNSMRIYHIDRSKVYMKFIGGDEKDVLEGKSYFSNATGTQGPQYRYLSPIYSNGEQIGFILVSTLEVNYSKLKADSITRIVLISSLALIITILLSTIVYRSIKQSLLGYEPEQIVSDLIIRKEVINSMEEGIIYVDNDDNILLMNDVAELMLNIKSEEIDFTELNIDDYLPNNDCIEKEDEDGNITLQCSIDNIIYRKINIHEDEDIVGHVYILADKELALKLAEELTGVKHIVASLRANNHEFLNKLHVISGLIQSDNTDEALDYINDVSFIQQNVLTKILTSIENKNIAALLLGKVSYCKEKEIPFNISSDCYLPEHSAFLSTYSITTIMGNLINNAIDSICSKSGYTDEPNNISVYIKETQSELTIMIEDTGKGMDEETVAKLIDGKYVSRSRNHGIGFKLIKNIIKDVEGTIDIESELDNGTNIAIFITKKRRDY